MMRDFTYIDDIVEGIFRIVQQPAETNLEWSGNKPDPASSSAPYKIYNIGNGNPVQLMDYIKAAEKALDKKAEKKFMSMQPGDVQKTFADISSLEKDFDYKPNKNIETGVNEFVKWYRKYYKV